MIALETPRSATAIRLAAICALVTVAACFSLARPTPGSEVYVLGSVARPVAAVPRRESGGVTVGLRKLDLAPYLATVAIVVRRGSRVVTSDFRQWGEDPAAGITRTVAASLEDSPAVLSVDVAPWPVRAQHDYLIQLHVSRLEGVAPEDSTAKLGEVRVAASWEIIRPDDGAIVARGETDRAEAGWKVGDYRGLVARLDTALTGLAGDVAACVVKSASAVPPARDQPAPARPAVCRRQ